MVNRWIFRLYNLLVLLLLPLIVIGVVWRWRKRILAHKELVRWDERWGHFPSEQIQRWKSGRWWWVHAVSMGEVKAIEAFLRKAPQHAGVKVVLSVVTPEALEYSSAQQVADEIIAAPIDLPWAVRSTFHAVQPEMFISVESEFWPNLLREARRSGAKVALINGRMSEHSFRSYQKVKGVLRALWSCFDLLAMRQEQDADRLRMLGADSDKIRVTGHLKYDLAVGADVKQDQNHSPVLILGSTREGEEETLLPVIRRVRAQFPELCVIWAPRHLERVNEVEALLSRQGLRPKRKTALTNASSEGTSKDVIWDSMGDLIEGYRQSDVAIVGGSFVPRGGQNPIEPAALQRPVVFGPSMENFLGISEVLVRRGGARQVDLEQLENCLGELIRNPESRRIMAEKARRAVESEQGASERTLRLLEALRDG